MRALIVAASVVGAMAQNNKLMLEAFNCGNVARHSPVAGSTAGAASFKIFVGDSTSNTWHKYTSAHCDTDPVSSVFPVVSSCVANCETARQCATKVFPEHCGQGCEKDCTAYQVAPATSPQWAMYTHDAASFSGSITVRFEVVTNGVGASYKCEYSDMSELTSAASYCVGKTTGASKQAAWPPTDTSSSDFDQLGQPWVKVHLVSSADTLTAALMAPATSSTAGALVDSDLASGTTDANKITGTSMGTNTLTCDGHCGTFTPGYGEGCSAADAAAVSSFGPAWHPTASNDCYCSCTTDCRIVGDCCHDYDLCSSTDLTVVGGIVQTQSPTNINGGTGMVGDPFTQHAGKRTQFYLPLGHRVKLLQYNDVELFGEAKPSKRKNDDQQWFKGFEVRHKGAQVATVEVISDALSLLRKAQPQTAAETFAAATAGDMDALAALKDRLARAKMELDSTHKLRDGTADEVDIDAQSSTRKSMRHSNRPLTTLNITVQGQPQDRETSNQQLMDGQITLSVAQDQARRIGNGFQESAWLEFPGLAFQLQSSLAQKFDTMAEKVEHLHINLKFNELNATACTGPLPEIWGVRAMSEATTKMLQPIKLQAQDPEA